MRYLLILTNLLLISQSILAQQQNKDKIAVYPFTTYKYNYYNYATSIGNAVETGFVKSSRFTVIERSKFNTLLKEDKTRENYTSDEVQIASKYGAQEVVMGHVMGVSTGSERKKALLINEYYTEYVGTISFSLKIVDVATGEISVSEAMTLSGTSREGNNAALGEAMNEIDAKVRQFISHYYPQRFLLMKVTDVDSKRNAVKEFKIWGGSENGIEEKNVVEIYSISFATHPVTGSKVENKDLIGKAEIVGINGSSISTCKMLKWTTDGKDMQTALSDNPDNIVIEFSGSQKNIFGSKGFSND